MEILMPNSPNQSSRISIFYQIKIKNINVFLVVVKTSGFNIELPITTELFHIDEDEIFDKIWRYVMHKLN